MSIQGKISKLQNIITEICQEIENEQPTDETAEDKFNEVINHIDLISDQIDDLAKAFDDYEGYNESDKDPYWFNYSYNGVSQKDFF